ncbi:hypothetical protein jhhlp_001291 [Lomentospora prolificans]|uniref:Zn(2)-C6 fungal-type domain-containing protein n=1 Tax=Lomentospora prolificans TaxID=41688 RepID=A0A2N3NHS9_9PEZI|nr:hypothetical protein jhhlp_001291 [Lomentospora prolificans]
MMYPQWRQHWWLGSLPPSILVPQNNPDDTLTSMAEQPRAAPLTPPSPPRPKTVVKRRACDECRSRKLACSKEPDGCSRCRRESLSCVYSAQKPMGRPKKRRQQALFSQAEQQAEPGPANGTVESYNNANRLSTPPQEHNIAAPAGSIPDFVSLSELLPSFDLAPSGFPDSTMPFDPFALNDASPLSMDFVNNTNLDQLNSAEPKLKRENVHKIFQVIAKYVFTQQISCSSNMNSDIAQAAPGQNVTMTPFKSHPNVTCPCLSSIYLALDSLNNISDDISTAMGTARAAARSAHDVLRCNICSSVLIEAPLVIPPMQSYQNMMLLSALLTSLSNSYFHLLEIIDCAAAEARSRNEMLHFSFRRLGGVWDDLNSSDSGGCLLALVINDSDLDPEVWRLAMRAVLRYEIYGFTTESSNPSCTANGLPQPQHFGLAQAVHDLEERSRLRHEKLDKLVAAGHVVTCSPLGKHTVTPPGGEKPQCMMVIESVKLALDRLSIA